MRFLCVLYVSMFFLCCSFSVFSQHPEKKAPVVLVVGTRPEAIKMLPLYWELQKREVPTLLCSTGQHKELLDNVWELFSVYPDVQLSVMTPGQDLFSLTQKLLGGLKTYFEETKPRLVVVQGDTTSAFVATLAAFYLHIPVAHVEAGLRTGNLRQPFPEEMNRKVISHMATLHFAPTEKDVANLLKENITPSSIFLVGNTVVDMLQMSLKKIETGQIHPSPSLVDFVEKSTQQAKKIVLFTMHRREAHNGGILRVLKTWKKLCREHADLVVVFPAHPNPKIRQAINEAKLSEVDNFYVIRSLDYADMVYLMDKAFCVVTDSGGVQEEATSLQKNVLIVREFTEREEALGGNVELVGEDEQKLRSAIERLLAAPPLRQGVVHAYGDGKASERIVQVILKRAVDL